MDISDSNIRFTFYLDGNKYIVFSLDENITFGDDLFFAREIKNSNYYESIEGDEYNRVLKEYMEYLDFSEGGEYNEN